MPLRIEFTCANVLDTVQSGSRSLFNHLVALKILTLFSKGQLAYRRIRTELSNKGLHTGAQLLSEIRRVLLDAAWRVTIDDHHVVWNEAASRFEPPLGGIYL